jgi:predicted transcriptional regulator
MHKLSAVSTKTSGSLASVTILESSKSSMAEKVLLILEVIANSEFPLTLENISSSIGLAKPTAFRLLNTLVAQGFVERDPNGRRYQPSAKFRLMGLSLLSTDSIRSQRVAIALKRLHRFACISTRACTCQCIAPLVANYFYLS